MKRSASTAQESELTRVASANEEWKSSEDSSSRNLWLDTLDIEHEDFVTSDEDQNDLDESNVSSHGNTFFQILNNGLPCKRFLLLYSKLCLKHNVPETIWTTN